MHPRSNANLPIHKKSIPLRNFPWEAVFVALDGPADFAALPTQGPLVRTCINEFRRRLARSVPGPLNAEPIANARVGDAGLRLSSFRIAVSAACLADSRNDASFAALQLLAGQKQKGM